MGSPRVTRCIEPDCQVEYVSRSNYSLRCPECARKRAKAMQREYQHEYHRRRSQEQAEKRTELRIDFGRETLQFMVVADPSGDFRPGRAFFSNTEMRCMVALGYLPDGMVLRDQHTNGVYKINEHGKMIMED